MKRALLSFFLTILLYATAHAATPQQAAAMVGSELEMKGECVQVAKSAKGGVFLNFGAPYPNQVISGFIAPEQVEDLGGFDFLKTFKGAQVTIVGKVVKYEGGVMIPIVSPLQLEK